MIEVGRMCFKLEGRDAGKPCVIVDILDERNVLIDGGVRRRKCNVLHLTFSPEVITLKKGASHAEVTKAFTEKNLAVWETKKKEAKERPRKVRKKKALEETEKKPEKKASEKKEVKEVEKKKEVKEEVKEEKKEGEKPKKDSKPTTSKES